MTSPLRNVRLRATAINSRMSASARPANNGTCLKYNASSSVCISVSLTLHLYVKSYHKGERISHHTPCLQKHINVLSALMQEFSEIRKLLPIRCYRSA